MNKTIQQWFADYSNNHQNPTNKKIHFVCVPFIFMSAVGLLTYIKVTPTFGNPDLFPYFNLGELLILGGLIFYLRLSIPVFIGMGLFSLLTLYLVHLAKQQPYVDGSIIFLSVFILAWLGQFYGHKLEGKRPSFFKDLVFLLIGPAWILGFILKKMKIKP
jgi:uncharacterized membrane protein YGL010W